VPDPVTGIIAGSSIIGGVSANKGASKAANAAQAASDATVAESRRQFDLVRSDTAGIRNLGNSALDRLSQLYGYGTSSSAPVPQMISPGSWGAGMQGGIAGTLGAGGGVAGAVSGAMGRAVPDATGSVTGRAAGPPDMSAFFQSPDYQFNLAEGQRAIDNSLVARGRGLSGAGVKAGVQYASGMASREYSGFVDRLMQQAGLGATGIGASAAAGANSASTIGNAYMNAGNTRASAYMQGAQGVNNALQGGASNYLLTRYLGTGGGLPPTRPGNGTPGYGGP
jgi:hypothetical protein